MAELDQAIKKVAELVDLGRKPVTVDGGTHPVLIVPDGHKVVPLADVVYNEHRDHPERKTGNVLRLRWLKLKHPRAWIRVVQFEREVRR